MADHEATTGKGTFALPTNLYDISKDFALIYIPAGAVLYTALAVIWGWGFTMEVNGTALAVDTFLGVILKISKTSYDRSDLSNDGKLTIDTSDPQKDVMSFEPTTPIDQLADQDKIVLKVQDITPNPTSQN